MRYVVHGAAASVVVMLLVSAARADPPGGPLTKCPPDAVISGPVCMDKYEARVWRVPEFGRTSEGGTKNSQRLIAKIQQGTATAADLEGGGATRLGNGAVAPTTTCRARSAAVTRGTPSPAGLTRHRRPRPDGLPRAQGAAGPVAAMTLEEAERAHIRGVLDATGWRVRGAGGAAQLLGLPPTTLESRMKKLGIIRTALTRGSASPAGAA